MTFIRFPDGVGGQQFFEKNKPNGTPAWAMTARLVSSGSRGNGEIIEYPLINDLPALVWAANLAALELHVPQWTIAPAPTKHSRKGKQSAFSGGDEQTGDIGRQPPDRLVIDLDPGPGATLRECARVALLLREQLLPDGLTPYATTSGSKGMQLYCAVTLGTASDDRHAAVGPSAYAKKLAQQVAREFPRLVTAKMAKAERPDRVFIDWSLYRTKAERVVSCGRRVVRRCRV
jgi:bifunctional non-homologous end joining protein LigD